MPILTFASIAVVLVATPIAFASVALLGANPATAGNLTASLVFLALNALVLSPFGPGGGARVLTGQQKMDKALVLWMWATGITHLSWELSWCLVHPYLHGVGPSDTWAWVWWSYGVADHRYLISDPFIVIMEWCTAVVGGPLNFYVLWLLHKKRMVAATVWVLVVSAMELYGTILYFGTEVVDHFRHVDTGDWLNLWVKFVGMNAIWIGYPLMSIIVGGRWLLTLRAPDVEVAEPDFRRTEASEDARAAAGG